MYTFSCKSSLYSVFRLNKALFSGEDEYKTVHTGLHFSIKHKNNKKTLKHNVCGIGKLINRGLYENDIITVIFQRGITLSKHNKKAL